MTVGEALRRGTDFLRAKGVENPRLDVELLLGRALGLTRIELYLQHDRPLGPENVVEARELLGRRARREPLAYILGEWGFRRLTLRVDRRALVPRPETEVLVERCLALLEGLADPAVLDVGTGSGAIALAIADEHPTARVTALDSSTEALDLARENVAATGLGDRVRLVEHDLASGFGSRRFELVVSNPPYIAPEEIDSLQPEVRDWEPRIALVKNGQMEDLARAALEALQPSGWFVVEVGEGQAAEVGRLLASGGYEEIGVTRDLAGFERIVEARAPERP
ncbi:MAG: peptide chain release factor N(5)-glutamine methyltransferase [Actinobacteria bacterium]|nr:peptide chain release factor N(5)-glutamine methyltransferase [Actinomycetota bacterium]